MRSTAPSIIETARLLGFDRTGTDLQAAIDNQITVLTESDRIRSESGHIYLVSNRGSKTN